MTRARLGVLAIAAALVIAGAIWLSAQRSLPRDTAAGELILPALAGDLESIDRVRLSRGNGSAVTLRRGASGWVVEERAFPADTGRLRSLLTALAQLRVVEEKTRDPRLYTKLGVEDVTTVGAQGTLVELSAPQSTLALIVGKTASAKHSYVRIPGREASFLAAPQVAADPEPRRWIDTRIVDVPERDVREVAVTPATGAAYVVARPTPDEALRLKGRSVELPIAGLLAALDCEDVGPASGAPPVAPRPTAIVQTFDGREITVHGREDGERRFIRIDVRAIDTKAEAAAQALAARVADREFELARYRFDGLFRPLPDPT